MGRQTLLTLSEQDVAEVGGPEPRSSARVVMQEERWVGDAADSARAGRCRGGSEPVYPCSLYTGLV